MPTTTTKYYKVMGAYLLDSGEVEHLLREVADYIGAPLSADRDESHEQHRTSAANEQPRGTIVRIVVQQRLTRTITLNPTS